MKLKLFMLVQILCIISFICTMLFAEPSRFQLVCAYLLNIFFTLMALTEMWQQYKFEKEYKHYKRLTFDPNQDELDAMKEILKKVIERNQEIIDKVQIDNGNSKQ